MVANRLTEIPEFSVLLLEAGGDETEISDVPVLAGYLQLSKMDWQYKTEPQDSACLAMSDRVSLNFYLKISIYMFRLILGFFGRMKLL